MLGKLTTHVLDTTRGKPASGLKIELHDASGTLLNRLHTNADGRADSPLLANESFQPGLYELTFFVGDFFKIPDAFLDIVPIRFRISDASQHYHVPLLCSPWAYSTYRGS